MHMPEKLGERLQKLGLGESIYEMRTKKAVASRHDLPLEKVPWFRHAYFVGENFLGKKDHFIFDPVSLVPVLALQPGKGEKILDMCAAPGTKTFLIDFLAEGRAEITANDISASRLWRLKHNAARFHISCKITSESGRKIQGSFDKILVDAPCSGEGVVNKKEKVFAHWSEKRVKVFSRKQKKLVENAFKILKPGGLLVYSTCTFGPEENEEVVDFLLKKFPEAGVEKIDVNIAHAEGLKKFDGKTFHPAVKNCMRIYPQHNGTSGFFVARMRKKEHF